MRWKRRRASAKKYDATRTAQRFTPRRPGSNWAELNEERARRLIAAGLMTYAGEKVLPDLSPHGYVAEQRKRPQEFAARLANLVKQSAAKKMFGNWDDSGLRRQPLPPGGRAG